MGLMNSALQIGRSAITTYQSALSVVGQNIANAADPDYTRQRAVLDPQTGTPLAQGIQPGGGVTITSLQRIINEALEERLRQALGDVQGAQLQAQILTQIENSFSELSNNDLSSQLSTLKNAFEDVQNNPSDVALRVVAIGQAAALAGTLRQQGQVLEQIVGDINDQIVATAEQADALARRVAELNVEVVEAESGGHVAGALRDARDALLRDLAELVQIKVRYQESGSATVFIGNETLVQYDYSRGLTTRPIADGDTVRQEVRFVDEDGQAQILGGQLQALIDARGGDIGVVAERLDQFAAGLIAVVNEIHSNGQGLQGFAALTSSNGVADTNAPLNSAAAGLPLPVQSGSFFVSMTDLAGGQTDSFQIDIDLDGAGGDDTSLQGLVDQINARVPNVTAAITADQRLSLTAEQGFEITFGHDTHFGRDDSSNVLAALGVNTFFVGRGAGSIEVNPVIAAQPELLAAARTLEPGDGTNAQAMAQLQADINVLPGGVDLFGFYNQMIGDLGVTTAAARARQDSADGILNALQAQRASISGVNLDEEAVELLRYERAFQGAARFTTVIDRLISELLAIAR